MSKNDTGNGSEVLGSAIHYDKLIFDNGLRHFKSNEELVCFISSLETQMLKSLSIICSDLIHDSDPQERRDIKEHHLKRTIWKQIADLEIDGRENKQLMEPDMGDQFNIVMNNLFMIVMQPNSMINVEKYKSNASSLTSELLDNNQRENLNFGLAVATRATRFSLE